MPTCCLRPCVQIFMPEMKRFLLDIAKRNTAAVAAGAAAAPGGPQVAAAPGGEPYHQQQRPAVTASVMPAAGPGPSSAAAAVPGSPAARPGTHVAAGGAHMGSPAGSPRTGPSNVLVSPLRMHQNAQGFTGSHSAFVAVFGESLHAFTSPTKDLQAINDRLVIRGEAVDEGLHSRDPKRRRHSAAQQHPR